MFRSLRTKLFVTVSVVVLIPLSALSIVGYYALRRTLQQTMISNMEALGQLQLSQIREFLQEKHQLARTMFSENQELWTWGTQIQQTSDPKVIGQAKDKLQQILKRKAGLGKLVGVRLLSRNKKLLAETGATFHKTPHPTVPLLPRGFRVIQILHFSHVTDTTARMVLPLRYHETIWAHLVVEFPFDLHQRFLRKKQGPAFQGMIYLLNQQGKVICGSFDVAHDHHVAGASKLTSARFAAFKNVANSPIRTYQNEKGVSVFGLLLPMSQLRLNILIELPERKAFQPLYDIGQVWGSLLVAVLLLLLVGIAVVAGQLIKPLRQLVGATRDFAQGNFLAPLPPARQDEVGELSLAFQNMGQELRESYDTLEERVEERTRELREAQRFLELLFHAIPEVIVCVDRELRISTANQKAKDLFGDDIIGSHCYHLWGGKKLTASCCPASHVLKTGEPLSEEDEHPNPHNGEFFYKDFFPIRDEDGEVVGVLESAKVITQQKQLMAQAIHHEKMAAIGLLASGVAHEIGNPLASISALLQRIQRKYKEPDLQDAVGELLERCDTISRIVGTLNSYARQKGNSTVPLNLNREIEKALSLLRFDKRLKSIQLNLELGQNLPIVWSREDALLQVVTNLVLNAMDALEGQDGASLTIQTWPCTRGARLQVIDNGPGVPEAEVQHIFEPFVTTKGPEKGTGLGLAVCKAIIDDMGGEILISNSSQQGAVFEVVLPASKQSSPEA